MGLQHERLNEARANVPMNSDLKAVIEKMAKEQGRSVAWVIRDLVWAALSMGQKVKVA